MATASDVAACILEHTGEISAMKLEKLVYYSQAWHLVWDEEPLFEDPIEAWANGPVVPALFEQHKGKLKVAPADIEGSASNLAPHERDTVSAVIDAYGRFSAADLSHMTHREAPWVDARRGLDPLAHSSNPITHDSMADYYTALYVANVQQPT